MSSRFQIVGMEEFRQALRNLPPRLVDKASVIVTARAEFAASRIESGYPEVSGNLKSKMTVRMEVSKSGVVARIRNTAKHAYIYENGTQVRQTKKGQNRGAMPPGHVFIPTAIRERKEMVDQLIAMVRDEGLVVTGG